MPDRKMCCYAKLFFKRLRLSDWFLLIFMAMLMVQSAHNMFFHELINEETSSLDTVIRTTMAAIFGYFISGGFLQRGQFGGIGSKDVNAVSSTTVSSETGNRGPQGRIGFSTGTEVSVSGSPKGSEGAANSSSAASLEKLHKRRIRQQIIIVGTIGSLSLLFLILVRNQPNIPAAAMASISQLRDFVSGSVGLLIGHSTRETD